MGHLEWRCGGRVTGRRGGYAADYKISVVKTCEQNIYYKKGGREGRIHVLDAIIAKLAETSTFGKEFVLQRDVGAGGLWVLDLQFSVMISNMSHKGPKSNITC